MQFPLCCCPYCDFLEKAGGNCLDPGFQIPTHGHPVWPNQWTVGQPAGGSLGTRTGDLGGGWVIDPRLAGGFGFLPGLTHLHRPFSGRAGMELLLRRWLLPLNRPTLPLRAGQDSGGERLADRPGIGSRKPGERDCLCQGRVWSHELDQRDDCYVSFRPDSLVEDEALAFKERTAE